MTDETRKLMKFVQYSHEEVMDAIGGKLSPEAQVEANRLLEGFFEVIRNGKELDAPFPDEHFAATIYAGLAIAHSIKEIASRKRF